MPTILELFENFDGKPKIKDKRETLIEQETTGIRVQSKVELNNPLLYGNESIRIANRSTPSVEKMEGSRGVEISSTGIIDQGITAITGGRVTGLRDVRDQFNSKLGIPSTIIPTDVASDGGFSASHPYEAHTEIARIMNDGEGSLLGDTLKKSGGGTPKTIGRQVAGTVIGRVKDGIRSKLFSDSENIEGISIQESDIIRSSTGEMYSPDNTYSKIIDVANEKDSVEDRFASPEPEIKLKDVSPVYGATRPSSTPKIEIPSGQPTYTKNKKWRGDKTLVERGFRQEESDGDELDFTGVSGNYKKDSESNLVPFWISDLDGSVGMTFRAYISAISETISPEWNSSKFVGNPYNYYTYSGVERSVTFSLAVFPTTATGLNTSWEKLSYLSKKAYPSIDPEGDYINPNFIRFRLGDLYNNRIALIESISYNVEDNSTWEIFTDGIKLPKYISVQVTFKLVEMVGSELSLYDYKEGAIPAPQDRSSIGRSNRAVAGEGFSGNTGTIT